MAHIMMRRFFIEQPTMPIPTFSVGRETQQARFRRLKEIADSTGRRFVQVYLEDERRNEYVKKRSFS